MKVDKDIYDHVLCACGGQLVIIRNGKYNHKRATDMLWRIIADLENVGAVPSDINSSFEELEFLISLAETKKLEEEAAVRAIEDRNFNLLFRYAHR